MISERLDKILTKDHCPEPEQLGSKRCNDESWRFDYDHLQVPHTHGSAPHRLSPHPWKTRRNWAVGSQWLPRIPEIRENRRRRFRDPPTMILSVITSFLPHQKGTHYIAGGRRGPATFRACGQVHPKKFRIYAAHRHRRFLFGGWPAQAKISPDMHSA